VISIDNRPRAPGRARAYLERGGVAKRVELIDGEGSWKSCPTLRSIDLAYVDAVKTEYRRYLDLLLPPGPGLRAPGLRQLLWKGHVAEPPRSDDANADALRRLNGYLSSTPSCAPPSSPGGWSGLATKTKPLVSEMGGPF